MRAYQKIGFLNYLNDWAGTRVFNTKITGGFLTALILTIVSGCSANSQALKQSAVEAKKVESEHVMEYLAAVDLINTLVQVPRLHPTSATVFHMRQPTSSFGQNIYEVMTIAGYDIQIVDTGNLQEPRVTYSTTLENGRTTFQINIENFKAKRSYLVVDNKVRPGSSIYIYGADPDIIKANDRIFESYDSA